MPVSTWPQLCRRLLPRGRRRWPQGLRSCTACWRMRPRLRLRVSHSHSCAATDTAATTAPSVGVASVDLCVVDAASQTRADPPADSHAESRSVAPQWSLCADSPADSHAESRSVAPQWSLCADSPADSHAESRSVAPQWSLHTTASRYMGAPPPPWYYPAGDEPLWHWPIPRSCRAIRCSACVEQLCDVAGS
jgi:hypothetical protein